MGGVEDTIYFRGKMLGYTLRELHRSAEIKTSDLAGSFDSLSKCVNAVPEAIRKVFFLDDFGLPSGVSLVSRTGDFLNNTVKTSIHFQNLK